MGRGESWSSNLTYPPMSGFTASGTKEMGIRGEPPVLSRLVAFAGQLEQHPQRRSVVREREQHARQHELEHRGPAILSGITSALHHDYRTVAVDGCGNGPLN